MLYFSEMEEETSDLSEEQEKPDRHLSEPWYHGVISKEEEEHRFQEFFEGCEGTEGAFLVRESISHEGGYTLVIWKNGKRHRIKIFQDKEKRVRYCKKGRTFSSLCNLIEHHTGNTLKTDRQSMKLSVAVPNPYLHEYHSWFYSNMSRGEAEEILLKIPCDGAFLIRSREEQDSYAITFRVEKVVKHCKFHKIGNKFVLGTSAEFDTIVELVQYYRSKPLYRKIKLWYPVTPCIQQHFQMVVGSLYTTKMYIDPSEIESSQKSVFGARHLPKPQRSIISPFIEVQLHEHSQEPKYFSTSITSDNGLNPVWDVFPTYTFSVNNSDLAFLQFIVSIEDMFSDPSFLAQATFPLRAVKTGFRAVSLTNGFSEEIELASLLVHVTIQKDVIKTPGAGL